MALVDCNYRFTYVDIGGYGSNSDSNVFRSLVFGNKLLNGKLDIPPPKPLPNFPTGGIVPHVIVADEAFPLTHNIMRPYPRFRQSSIPKDEAIYNYRLSRARMVVENAFGILAMRWRLFDRRLALCADNADKVIKACCVLHNFLTPIKDYDDIATELNPDGRNYNQNGMLYLSRLRGYHATHDAQGVRDVFKGFFNNPAGALTFQETRVSFRITNPAKYKFRHSTKIEFLLGIVQSAFSGDIVQEANKFNFNVVQLYYAYICTMHTSTFYIPSHLIHMLASLRIIGHLPSIEELLLLLLLLCYCRL